MNNKAMLQVSLLVILSLLLMPIVGIRLSPANAAVISGEEQISQPAALAGVSGVVTDATSGAPIENAYVFIQNTIDCLDFYADAFTDANG